MLKKCFETLVETGIEGSSINNLSNATGMTSSSLYYWFKDKDEILLDATEYGLKKVLGALFAYAMKLSEQLNRPFEKVRLLIDLIVSIVIDVVIWKEWNKFSAELRYICNDMLN